MLIDLSDILTEKKIGYLSFLIGILVFTILIMYVHYKINNTICYDENQKLIIIKRFFLNKKYSSNDVQVVDRFVLPYLNYIKIGGKSYLFVSRTVDIFGGYFNLNFEKDLEEIRNLLKHKK